jgi:hypothetical protein
MWFLNSLPKMRKRRAAGSYWDPVEQCVRNEDDAHVASLADIDDDYNFPTNKKDKHTIQIAPERPEPPSMTLQRNTFGEDDDSIGTFRRDYATSDSVSLSCTTISEASATISSLTSRLSALEKLLSTHNIALPVEITADHRNDEPSKNRESGHN